MTLKTGDDATVTLPRWFVVLLFSVLTAATGAFFKLDASMTSLSARLSVIEFALGIPMGTSGDVQRWGVQFAPEARAESSQVVAPRSARRVH